MVRKSQSPSPDEKAAFRRGVNDLYSILDWVLQDRPRTRARWRREYTRFALRIYRAIGRVSGIRP